MTRYLTKHSKDVLKVTHPITPSRVNQQDSNGTHKQPQCRCGRNKRRRRAAEAAQASTAQEAAEMPKFLRQSYAKLYTACTGRQVKQRVKQQVKQQAKPDQCDIPPLPPVPDETFFPWNDLPTELKVKSKRDRAWAVRFDQSTSVPS